MLVDGYNVIHAWGLDTGNLENAREELIAALDDYAGYTDETITIVFDGYNRKAPESEENRGLLTVVFTAFGVTADTYIQRAAKAARGGVVVTADGAEQFSVFASGAIRITPAELADMIRLARERHLKHIHISSLTGGDLKKRLAIDAVNFNE